MHSEILTNLEHNIQTASWLCDKIRESEIYAQNLYAALCNNQFQRLHVWMVLKDDRWSCTWRHAGSIIANIRGSGDYMDWYCSGMGFWTSDDVAMGYVPEGMVTSEVYEDLSKLGWTVWQSEEIK